MNKQYFLVSLPSYGLGVPLRVREKRTFAGVDVLPVVKKHHGDVAAIAAELSPFSYSSRSSARRASVCCAVLSLRELLALVYILEVGNFESERERQLSAQCVFMFLRGV